MLSVNFMGLQLKNPLVVAAGPWAKNHQTIQKAIDAGAGAVITETITMEKSNQIYPRIYEKDGELLNTTFHSTLSFETWEEELHKLKKKGSAVICSIRGSTPSELAYIATRLERWGADALEISLFTPIGVKLENVLTEPQEIRDMLTPLARAVGIPFSVLLPNHLACTNTYVRAVESAGASAITAIQTIKALWGVDLERQCSRVPTFGGYSGPHIFPITLAATATLSQLLKHCQISAKGGVRTAENVLECIMLGASTVQLGSAVLLNGYGVITDMLQALEAWLRDHQVNSCDEIRGVALNSLSSFEDIDPLPAKAVPCKTAGFTAAEWSLLENCCRACMANALHIDEGPTLRLDRTRCDGCGLCCSLSQGLLEMQPVYPL